MKFWIGIGLMFIICLGDQFVVWKMAFPPETFWYIWITAVFAFNIGKATA